MGRRPRSSASSGCVVCVTLVALALLAGTAHAKPWAKLAPAPLASDSSYEALSARPADSLSTDEYAWVDVQRDWRSQRKGEVEGSWHGIDAGPPHVSRPADARFARLASQPFAALSMSERSWLITESAAQRADRRGGGAGTAVGIILLGAAAGVVATLWVISSAFHQLGN